MKPGIASSISLVLVSGVLLLSLFLTVSPPAAKAQAVLPPPATLSIYSEDTLSYNITNPNLKAGSTFIIDVRGDNLLPITNSSYGGVLAMDITVNYDFHILKAIGIGFSGSPPYDTPPCSSTDGCLWDGLPAFVYAMKVDSPPGTARLSLTGQGSTTFPYGRIQGSGILFRILFQVKGVGYTDIIINPNANPPTQIIGPLGHEGNSIPLPYTTANGSFDNTPLYILFDSPTSGSVFVGRSVTTTVTAFMETGGPENVSLSATQLPAGATASFKPSFGFTTFTSLLNITTASTTPTGNYTVRITGLCHGCANGFDFTQNVNFTLSISLRNIAVLNVTPSATAADVGHSVPVSVIVKNKGLGLETFKVNLLANTTTIATQSVISLMPGTTQTITFTWDTTSFQPGLYTISAQVPPLPGESNVTDNVKAGGNVRLGFPDAAVTSLTTTSSVVNPGQTLSISITVANQGLSPENFTVNVSARSSSGMTTQLGSRQVTSLAAGQSTMVTVSWSTSGFNSGTYTIHAEIPALENETVLTNNSLDGSVRLNAAPTASFTIPTTTPTAGQDVRFDASLSSDSDGTIATYSWNFGDGSTGPGKTVTHTYQTQGIYTVTLTVTDNDGGTKTMSQTVTVAAAPGGLQASPLVLGVAIPIVLILAIALLLTRRRGKRGKP